MNYTNILEAIKEGKRVSRPTWGAGEAMWEHEGVLFHNKPYWKQQPMYNHLGYIYVTERVDLDADDWFLLPPQDSTSDNRFESQLLPSIRFN